MKTGKSKKEHEISEWEGKKGTPARQLHAGQQTPSSSEETVRAIVRESSPGGRSETMGGDNGDPSTRIVCTAPNLVA